MNTIKTMKLLGRLAELIEIWQEPTDEAIEELGTFNDYNGLNL